MDSWWTPDGLQVDSRINSWSLSGLLMESFWTPDGVHQDSWLSVMTSRSEREAETYIEAGEFGEGDISEE